MAHKKPFGDTLIEVLFSIAIVSVVVTIAYTVANRSLNQGVTASEHTEALQLAQGQVEALKYREQLSNQQDFLTTFDAATTSSPQNFCLDTTANSSTDKNWAPASNGNDVTALNTLATSTDSPKGPYDPSCYKDSKYYINIHTVCADDKKCQTQPQGSFEAVYHVTVMWNAVGGNGSGQNQTQLYYKFSGVTSAPPIVAGGLDLLDCGADLTDLISGAVIRTLPDGTVQIAGPNGAAQVGKDGIPAEYAILGQGAFTIRDDGSGGLLIQCAHDNPEYSLQWDTTAPGTGSFAGPYNGGNLAVKVEATDIRCSFSSPSKSGAGTFDRATGNPIQVSGNITAQDCLIDVNTLSGT